MSVELRTHPSGPVAEAFAARLRAREASELAPRATPSYPAERARPEADCGLRTPFQRDRDRIVHSKSFRRLKHKTQVFVAPEGDHYRTRLTHTLEVTQVSRTVARALRLNEDLTEAIGLGHRAGWVGAQLDGHRPSIVALASASDRRLRRRHPRDRHAKRRARDVVEPGHVEELDRVGVSPVLAADAELEIRP